MRTPLVAAALLALVSTSFAAPSGPSVTPDAALKKLVAGNARFASGSAASPHNTEGRRTEVSKGQHPFAIIVSCSDSRVPPELVFDQGLGDLFVVRVAGNIVDDNALGSVEYAVAHLGAKFILVLGHSKCGAVDAAVQGGDPGAHVRSIVREIAPAVSEAKKKAHDDLLKSAIEQNALDTAHKIGATSPVVGPAVKSGDVKIAAGYYDLATGKVTILK